MPENTEDSGLFRSQLRKTLLAKRLALPATTHSDNSGRIRHHLQHWLSELTATSAVTRSLGFCLPFKGEPDLTPLMSQLADAGWALCVPVAEQRAAAMLFREWHPGIALTTDRHGVAIPRSAVVAAPAILLVPALGIDTEGFRLGYGGGYFDRTLAALASEGIRPLCMGIGFELARVATIRPRAHDRALAALTTEAGVFRFGPDACVESITAPTAIPLNGITDEQA